MKRVTFPVKSSPCRLLLLPRHPLPLLFGQLQDSQGLALAFVGDVEGDRFAGLWHRLHSPRPVAGLDSGGDPDP